MVTLPYKLLGDSKSKTLLVFLHGYPNTMNLWKDYVDKMKDDCYIVLLSYPNYVDGFNLDNTEPREVVADIPWGIEPDEIIERIKNTLDLVNKEKRKIMFVSHDWGAFYTFYFDKAFPQYIEDFICLDVSWSQEKSFKNVALALGYRLLLALSFILGSLGGSIIIKFTISKIFQPKPREAEIYDPKSTYLYYYVLRQLLKGLLFFVLTLILSFKIHFIFLVLLIPIYLKVGNKNIFSRAFTKDYVCPKRIAFLYASDKPIMFHSKNWLKRVTDKSEDNEVHSVVGGHWISLYHTDFILGLIQKRIDKFLK